MRPQVGNDAASAGQWCSLRRRSSIRKMSWQNHEKTGGKHHGSTYQPVERLTNSRTGRQTEWWAHLLIEIRGRTRVNGVTRRTIEIEMAFIYHTVSCYNRGRTSREHQVQDNLIPNKLQFSRLDSSLMRATWVLSSLENLHVSLFGCDEMIIWVTMSVGRSFSLSIG